MHNPSRSCSQTTPPQDLSPFPCIPHQDSGSSTEQASITTLNHPTPTVHASYPPITSEQLKIAAKLTRRFSGCESIETGLLHDGLTARCTADISEDTLSDSPPSAEDSEQRFSPYSAQDVMIDNPSLAYHHLAKDANDIPAALEAGRGFAANKLKRTRSWSSSYSEEMPGSADPAWVRKRLEQHNMFQDGGQELNRFPRFKAAVYKIIAGDRNSAGSQEEFENFTNEFEVYKNQNEDTLFEIVLPAIIKEDRKIRVPSKVYPEKAVWESVRFFDSGIVTIVNREYERGCVPFRLGIHPADHELVAAMKKRKDPGMQNPKPARAYGMRRDKHQFPPMFQMPHGIRDHLEILQGLHLPFMIIEGDAEKEGSQGACNQACRGGAALNNNHRRLRESLGLKDKVGPDEHTIVFTATHAVGILDVYVSWAEVRKGFPPLYHMSLVASKSLKEADTFRQARIVLHNILNWGCCERFDGLDPLYKKIIAYSKTQQRQEESSESSATETTAEGREKTNEGGEKEAGQHKKQKTTHP
ncbi:MAG: hypothetical protein LQ345_006812 [Seirophora villosa]|nr:MAG: hypothetical protein LQ345_006812 [Seirophora villosa]